MEKIYKTYTREINGKVYYFVKKFISFSEYDNSTTLLDTMGMHTDFFKACEIAKVFEEEIIKKLSDELHIVPKSIKVLPINNHSKSMNGSFIKNTHRVFSKLKWASF